MTAPAIPPPVSAARHAERLRAARDQLAALGSGALLVGVGADLRWLTGYAAMPLERLTLLVVPVSGPPALLVPRLEVGPALLAPAVAAGAVQVLSWEETEDPFARVPALVGALPGDGTLGASPARSRRTAGASAARSGRTLGASPAGGRRAAGARPARLLVSDRLPAAFLLQLQATFPEARFGLASAALRELRMVKDAEEVALLRAAAGAADRVVAAIARGRLVGRSELEVAREVRERLVDEGHETASFSIVGCGPNSASPHHAASARRIGPGEPIVLDIGGTLGGYGSDVTRTLWVTGGDPARGPDAEFRALYGVLQAAQAAAAAAARPGVSCEQVDRVARDAIASAGHGPHFIHRTGHGIGLEEHEDPYLVQGNRESLRAGYAFSVEPGIYLEGRYGARIEDIVVCGPQEPELLNRAPRELLVVDG